MPKLTVAQAKKIVAGLGCTLRKTDFGDYRLSDTFAVMQQRFPGETRAQIIERIELRAYYTNDVADAVQTARYYRESL